VNSQLAGGTLYEPGLSGGRVVRVAYTLKFMLKQEQGVDYAVMPLEGLWWTKDMREFSIENKEIWQWTMMIMQPEEVTKMAETLDRLSSGRLILVLGGGGPMNESAYRAFGLESRSPGAKVEALEEAIDILRGLWGTSGFSYTGQHFRTEGATIEPKPGHPIPIRLGVFGDRMLDVVGRKADGWLPTSQYLAPEQAYRKLAYLRESTEHAGRNPDHLTYGYTIPVLVEEGSVTTRGQVAGSAEEVAKQLTDVVRHGFTFLNLWPNGEGANQRERLAREVLPIVRDLIGSDSPAVAFTAAQGGSLTKLDQNSP